mgnify:CR=1 FL=1
MLRSLILIASGLVLMLGAGRIKAQAAAPANKNSTDEVKGVLNYIKSIAGTHIIAGQHDKPGYPVAAYNWAQEITGRYPGIWGGDFGFSGSGNDTIYNRTELVNQAKLKWSEGVIPSLTWHMTRPDKAEPSTWSGGLIDCGLSADDWQAITTPGTSYYNCFISRIDSIVWALQELQNAGVPVLWRPFHEMNGNWFWWGGNSYYSKELYKIMYDRYTNHWGLNNLIWVWNVDRPADADLSQYYPGHEYVDILSMDIYNNDFNYSYYQTMQHLANGKPIALGEVGEIPSEAVLNQQPDWTWFMCWTEHLQENNSNSHIQSIYWLDRTLTRDGLGNFYDYITIGGSNGADRA